MYMYVYMYSQCPQHTIRSIALEHLRLIWFSASGLSYWIDMRLTDELGARILIFRTDISVF